MTKAKEYPKLAKTGFQPAFRVEEAKRMPITVEMTDAAERLEELVAAAEAGEEVVILRDGAAIAKLTAFDPEARRASIEDVRARAIPVTAEELIAWKNEGRRY